MAIRRVALVSWSETMSWAVFISQLRHLHKPPSTRLRQSVRTHRYQGHRRLGAPRSHQSVGACSPIRLAVSSGSGRLQNFHSSLAHGCTETRPGRSRRRRARRRESGQRRHPHAGRAQPSEPRDTPQPPRARPAAPTCWTYKRGYSPPRPGHSSIAARYAACADGRSASRLG